MNYYFLGIGGIGMSAIARYYKSEGFYVAGYDRVRGLICEELEGEGFDVHYEDDPSLIPLCCQDPALTVVVYTPAVPEDSREFCFFKNAGFKMYKRSQVLGEITRNERGLCVAGTHGKTTTSTILAHLLYQSSIECNAFLGGISNNYETNLLLSPNSNFVVIEADEFDRSFHYLHPYMAIVTSVDPDHLDIYGDVEGYRKGFEYFTSLIQPGGALVMKKGLLLKPCLQKGVKLYTYSANEKADFYADNIRISEGEILFDFVAPTETIHDLKLGVPVLINIENSVAAMAVAWLNGITHNELRTALSSYAGIYRRFNVLVKNERVVLVDDYAHHPAEIRASIESVRKLYPNRKLTGVFQPHLYSRTRDFAEGFAESLSLLDELIMLPIYPARELPIEGVSSALIYDKVVCPVKQLVSKDQLLQVLSHREGEVILTLGAGDIDALVPKVAEMLKNEYLSIKKAQ